MTSRAPHYRRYGKDYARVNIDCKWIQLYRYGSDESKAKYRRLIAQWATASPVEAAFPE
jgi:hypothetical protein